MNKIILYIIRFWKKLADFMPESTRNVGKIYRARYKTYGDCFESGSSPIGDILFICLGAFILLFFVARFETETNHEKVLPDLRLSQLAGLPSLGNNDAVITISVTIDNSVPLIMVDDHRIAIEDLEAELLKTGGIAKVALRRDKDLTIGIEDEIIAACTRAGIEKVSLVIQTESTTTE